MLAMTDGMFIYVLFIPEDDEVKEADNHLGLFLMSFVLLLYWVGKSHERQRCALYIYYLLIFIHDLLYAHEVFASPSVYLIISHFLLLLCFCRDMDIFRQSWGLTFEFVVVNSPHLNLWICFPLVSLCTVILHLGHPLIAVAPTVASQENIVWRIFCFHWHCGALTAPSPSRTKKTKSDSLQMHR